jgi:DNA-damage-inducible protein J
MRDQRPYFEPDLTQSSSKTTWWIVEPRSVVNTVASLNGDRIGEGCSLPYRAVRLEYKEGEAMAVQTEKIQARIEPALKDAAEAIFKKLGLSSTEAIRLFYRQVELREGLPFPVEIPNKRTIAAMRELERGGGKRFHSAKELFADWKR